MRYRAPETLTVVRCLAAALATLCACQRAPSPVQAPTAAPPAALRTMIDDADIGTGPNKFAYTGRWEHIAVRNDGRSRGTSSRSFHSGDTATLRFGGSQVRLYGVRGPKGGVALIRIDGRPAPERPDFYAPAVRPGELVYVSPVLAGGPHTLSIVVSTTREAHGGAFVNIDYAAVTGR